MTESTGDSAESAPAEAAPTPVDQAAGVMTTAETATADADVVPSSAVTASDVVAEPPAGEAVPTSEPPAGELAPVMSATAPTEAPTANGPKGKTRSPIGGWLLLIPTLGIYYLFWYFNINRELRDYDSSIRVKPGWAVVSLFIPVVGLISIYNTGSRIRQAQATAGGPAEASGLLGLIASLFFVLDIPYYSSQLNKVWQHA